MNRWIAVLAVTGLFVIGILIGILGTHVYYANKLMGPVGPPRAGRAFFVNRLEARLGLSPEQRREIDRILEQSHAESAEIRQEVEPRIREHLEETHRRIAAVLTPDQRERFEAMVERHRRWAAEGVLAPPGHGPHRRGPPPH